MAGFLLIETIIFIIALIVGIIGAIIGAFTGHIIFFDSVAMGIISGVCCHNFIHIHPAFCLLIGIGVVFLLMFIQNTKVGFWIIGGIFTFCYAFLFGTIAYAISNKDMIWFWVIFGLSVLFVGGLHLKARNT